MHAATCEATSSPIRLSATLHTLSLFLGLESSPSAMADPPAGPIRFERRSRCSSVPLLGSISARACAPMAPISLYGICSSVMVLFVRSIVANASAPDDPRLQPCKIIDFSRTPSCMSTALSDCAPCFPILFHEKSIVTMVSDTRRILLNCDTDAASSEQRRRWRVRTLSLVSRKYISMSTSFCESFTPSHDVTGLDDHAIPGTNSWKSFDRPLALLTNADAISGFLSSGSCSCKMSAGYMAGFSAITAATLNVTSSRSERGLNSAILAGAGSIAVRVSSSSSASRLSLKIRFSFLREWLRVSTPGPSRTPKRKRPSKTSPLGHVFFPSPCSCPNANSPSYTTPSGHVFLPRP
mmetsp:Transcript_2712/g.5818  ORF Transcript_2712/g.5818 Transcript_2712/m.5818 type:complete len:352 (+) Transcript_2712:384-1439(+)